MSLGAGILFSSNYYKKAFVKLLENSTFLILGGFIAIILGILILENHNIWVKNWTVIITIIGWVALIKGVILIVFPKSAKGNNNLFQSKKFIKFFMTKLVIGCGMLKRIPLCTHYIFLEL